MRIVYEEVFDDPIVMGQLQFDYQSVNFERGVLKTFDECVKRRHFWYKLDKEMTIKRVAVVEDAKALSVILYRE